nr:reverse transcriptase domain-containing protein [Tanacetum cinerariifolium]
MKEMRDGCKKCEGPYPSSEYDEKPMGGPEKEANYIYEGYRGNYYGRNSRNWRDRSDDKPYRPPPTQNEQVNALFTRSGKTYDPPENLNDKTAIIYGDSDDEADKAKKKKNQRPFLHTADAIIRVKSKELNLGIRDDRVTFLIDKVMQHSHSKDDICFRTNVVDEVTKEELDALINDSEPSLSTSEDINEITLDKEFEEFMNVDVKEIPEQEEEVSDNFEELPLDDQLRIKISIQDPPTDLEMKPLPKHLEYAFLEKRFSSSSNYIRSAQS